MGFWLRLRRWGRFAPGCRKETPAQSETHLRVMAEPWMFLKYPLRRAKERFEGRHPGVTVELLKAPDGYQYSVPTKMSGQSTEQERGESGK